MDGMSLKGFRGVYDLQIQKIRYGWYGFEAIQRLILY